MDNSKQVKNGKAFEYALASEYYNYLRTQKLAVQIVCDASFSKNKSYFDAFSPEEQSRYRASARATIRTMVLIEPGLTAQEFPYDILKIRMAKDSEGQLGDVRDIIFSRELSNWEIGFSAKNNNDAVKHSRLSNQLDFGKDWLGVPCSDQYRDDIKPIFEYIDDEISNNPQITWEDLGTSKSEKIYVPLLKAFRKELLRIDSNNKDIPAKLVSYLIGNKPFYKIIKYDASNMVIVKAFNIDGKLNQSVNGIKSRYKVAAIDLPKRIVEIEFKENSDNTLNMILDGGWEISFRIHNASKTLEHSLKFDIKLLGNPPVLFSQYLFQ